MKQRGHEALQRQDYAAALDWYRKAAYRGDAFSQTAIADLYYNGRGVARDYSEAMNLYRKAGDQGDAKAQAMLGVMYMLGEGVTKDYTLSMAWFRKAADQGYAGAQAGIGILYRDGLGVPKDYDQAEIWYRKAASQGFDEAKKQLAELQQKRASQARLNADKIPAALQYKCAFMSESSNIPVPKAKSNTMIA